MKIKEIRNKKKDELLKELSEKLIALKDVRFGVAGSKSKNVNEYRNIRKDIARIKTVLNDLN